MKRFSSSDSLGTMLYPSPAEEKAKEGLVYSREFHAMLDSLDDEGCIEESGHATGKKRRLSIGQVQALEKIFQVDNKLDPERKVKLAREIGLQPRQVAIWFQNRRARWKTKQLERDYNLLKADFENLQLNYSKVDQEKERLLAELKSLKEKLGEEGNTEWNKSIGKATLLSSQNNAVSKQCNKVGAEFKDGSSDSDSSGILNEHNNLNYHHPHLSKPSSSATSNDPSALCLSSSMHYPHQFLSSRTQMTRGHQQHGVKMEELSFFSLEEACNIFSVDQAPNLAWYLPDQRANGL